MRSTRRLSETLPIVVLVSAAVGMLLFLLLAPSPIPTAPRWQGAGNEEPQRGGTFVFHHESNVRGMDPHISFDELSNMAIRLLFDGLIDYDGDAELIPSIADLPTVSADGQTFTFRLREGVRFHNGEEVTAATVKWSMERMLHQDTGSPGYPFYKSILGCEAFHRGETTSIRGIRVVDEYTVEFTLAEPDQTFLNAMGMTFAYPVPREMYEREDEDGNELDPKQNPIGSGPFVLESWERGVRLTFVRNDDYWQAGKPYVDRMVFQENLRRHLAVRRFQNGDLDAVHRFTIADYLDFKSPEFSAWHDHSIEEPKVNLWGFAMNNEIPPFDNVHVRRAVAFAIDREGWSNARAGRLQPTGQPLPPQLMGYDENLESRQFLDLDRAREEMRLAGHPVTQQDDKWVSDLEPVTVWMGEGESARIYAALIMEDLAKIGVTLEMRHVAFAEWLQATGTRGRAQMLFTGWNMDFPDPDNFLFLWHTRAISPTNSNNRAFYSNPEYDALLDRARAETNRTTREGMYRQASEIIASDAPWAFVCNDRSFEAWQPYVHGYTPNPVWSENYRDVWLDLPRRRAMRESLLPLGRFASLLLPGLR